MSEETPRTFAELFKLTAFNLVEIPIIQRDYAQGRDSEEQIRKEFIAALGIALKELESNNMSLDLDFVYGSIEQTEEQLVFSPLDGQQRLTTLFLLHWYLACRDNKLDHFQSLIIGENGNSRFSYKVRPSSAEFFDALINSNNIFESVNLDNPSGLNDISESIRNAGWYFLAWERDPTVYSALAVLDEIHLQLHKHEGLYDRLVNTDHPAITFQFLNLRDFGLSDELYIKMNARGKPLTPFEAFKARLKKKADELLNDESFDLKGKPSTAGDYFAFQVDTVWADLFWNYKSGNASTFDHQFMNFVRGLITVCLPFEFEETEKKSLNEVIQKLTDYQEDYNFYRYEQDNCLTRYFTIRLINLLDQFCDNGPHLNTFLSDPAYYDEKSMFLRILKRERPGGRGSKGVVLYEWVQFFGFCSYLYTRKPSPDNAQFSEWMRVISNLSTNTAFNRADDFVRALRGSQALLEVVETTDIVDFISNPSEKLTGFSRQQIREERLKAQLMLRSESWRDVIMTAECHPYFKGQIEFLLDFCGVLDSWLESGSCSWDDTSDAEFISEFLAYYEKIAAVFGKNGPLEFGDYLWERALLSIGDYTLLRGRSNNSLLFDRYPETSWKRLLRSDYERSPTPQFKRNIVKQLLNDLDPENVEGSLQTVVDRFLMQEDVRTEDWWRYALISSPKAIKYCQLRCFRWIKERKIYLLSKEQMNGKHVDLLTFLVHERLDLLFAEGKFSNMGILKYEESKKDDVEPCILFPETSAGYSIKIENSDGRLELEITNNQTPITEKALAKLDDIFGLGKIEEGRYIVRCGEVQVDSKLESFDDWL